MYLQMFFFIYYFIMFLFLHRYCSFICYSFNSNLLNGRKDYATCKNKYVMSAKAEKQPNDLAYFLMFCEETRASHAVPMLTCQR